MSKDKTPPSKGKKALALVAGLFSMAFLANIPFVELLPDALPVVGNLDEVFFVTVLFWAMEVWGIRGRKAIEPKVEKS